MHTNGQTTAPRETNLDRSKAIERHPWSASRGTCIAARGHDRSPSTPSTRAPTYSTPRPAVVIQRRRDTSMRPTQQEFTNPREWLTQLADERDGYRRLVRESGGAGRAAYRLARARCSATHGQEPCLEDLQAAAELLATKLGSGGALPIKSLLPNPRSTPPGAKSLAPMTGSAAPPTRSAASTTNSAPPAPPSAERRSANKSRARQSAPILRVNS